MPLKLNVGLSKKIGQPDYGSLGASCSVELELNSSLLQTDLDGFHERASRVFAACRQAVRRRLHGLQSRPQRPAWYLSQKASLQMACEAYSQPRVAPYLRLRGEKYRVRPSPRAVSSMNTTFNALVPRASNG